MRYIVKYVYDQYSLMNMVYQLHQHWKVIKLLTWGRKSRNDSVSVKIPIREKMSVRLNWIKLNYNKNIMHNVRNTITTESSDIWSLCTMGSIDMLNFDRNENNIKTITIILLMMRVKMNVTHNINKDARLLCLHFSKHKIYRNCFLFLSHFAFIIVPGYLKLSFFLLYHKISGCFVVVYWIVSVWSTVHILRRYKLQLTGIHNFLGNILLFYFLKDFYPMVLYLPHYWHLNNAIRVFRIFITYF